MTKRKNRRRPRPRPSVARDPGIAKLENDLRRQHLKMDPGRVANAIFLRQAENVKALRSRPERFAQLLAKGTDSRRTGVGIHMASGLSRRDHEELIKVAPEQASKYVEEIQRAVARLRALIATVDPIALLARVFGLNLLQAAGEYFEPEADGSEAKVELVAGIILTQPPSSTTDNPPDPHSVQEILDTLDELFLVSMLATLAQGIASGDPEEADLQVKGRLYRLSVRGDAYVQHSEDLARRIFSPISGAMRDKIGFTIEDVIIVAHEAANLMDERVNRYRSTLSKRFVQLGESPTELAVRGWLEEMNDGWTEASSFELIELIARLNDEERDRAAAVIAHLSAEPGSYEALTFRGPLDWNPICAKPFVVSRGRCILPIPGLLLRELATILEDVCLEAFNKFDQHRATVLDESAVEFMVSTLPDAHSYTSLYYALDDGGERFELDGLIILDDIAIVVEGKGGGLSPQARRGDIRRLKSDIARNVEEAWRQGARARRYLLDGEARFEDQSGVVILTVPTGRIKKVFIVNPTLHAFDMHAPMLPALRGLGLFQSGEFPFSVYINDLRIVADTTRNAAEFLHYLEIRAQLPLGDRVTAVDEIDIFNAYLLCEDFDARLDEVDGLHLTGSTDFDSYYMKKDADGDGRRPRKFSIPLVESFVDLQSRRRGQGWLEMAGACLDLSLGNLAYVDALSGRLIEGIGREEVRTFPAVDGCAIIAVGPAVTRDIGRIVRLVEDAQFPPRTRVIVVSENHLRECRIVWATRIPAN